MQLRRHVRASLGRRATLLKRASPRLEHASGAEGRHGASAVTGDDLRALAVTVADLADPDVMTAAWR